MFSILVVEDNEELNRTVCEYLESKGYRSTGCLNAEDGYDALYKGSYDLVISDIMMPNIDGFEFAETIRKLNENLPILFVTARDDFASKQRGFRVGVDDYLVKPVNLDEMLLHIGALLRRAGIAQSRKLVLGEFEMNMEERSASLAGEEISLTQREFDILFKLLSYPKKTFTRTQLMDEFWDADSEASTRSVDVYVTKLRDKLSACQAFEIKAVRGIGYKAIPLEREDHA
ncbi:MAG: response regulator transcription factor [Lachnospiraceae bacterium]|nr:response regulator transcription factor [Lachnospiraceae bacterium]